jgi:NAD(P)-dependent dehydrogenase (short-subunit alcohol dehydrogenase family)
VERFGSIDIGVNCAGISGNPTSTHEMSLAEWNKVIAINQTGVWLCQRALIRQMLTQEYVIRESCCGTLLTHNFVIGRVVFARVEELLSMFHLCLVWVVHQGHSVFRITLLQSTVCL